MSDRILTNYVVEPTTLQPFLTGELDFLQDGITGLTTSLAQGLTAAVQYSESPFSGSPYIISGQLVNDIKVYVSAGVIYNYAPCWIYVPSQDEIFYFQGGIINDTLGECFQIIEDFPNPSDPITFSDGSQHNVMQSRRLTIVNSGGTGTTIFNFSDLQSLRGDWIEFNSSGAPAFQNGWSAQTISTYTAPAFRFNSMSQEVELRGFAINSSGSTSTTMAVLPVAYRPKALRIFPAYGFTSTGPIIAYVLVNQFGAITLDITQGTILGTTFQVSLDAVKFDLT